MVARPIGKGQIAPVAFGWILGDGVGKCPVRTYPRVYSTWFSCASEDGGLQFGQERLRL